METVPGKPDRPQNRHALRRPHVFAPLASFAAVLIAVALAFAATAQQKPLPPIDLSIQLLDDAGAPVAGAEVACVRWFFYEPPRTEPLRDDERVTTDAAGKCAFTGLTAEEYGVYAFRGDLSALERVKPHELNGATVELKLAPNPPAEIQLRDLHGQVLPDVLVLHEKCVPLGYSGKEGRLRFPSIFQPWFSFVKPGFGYTRSDFNQGLVEVFLAPGAALELTVVDDQGNPVAGAEVLYEAGKAVTDAEGKLRTIELPCYTKFRFQATAGDLAADPVITVGSEPVQQAQIQLKKGGAKKAKQSMVFPGAPYTPGRVALAALDPSDRSGRSDLPTLYAAANAQVESETYVSGKVVMADSGDPVRARLYSGWEGGRYDLDSRGRTEADGTFKLPRSKLGGYLYVHPEDSRYYAVESPVTLLPNASLENLVFTVKPGCSLRGHVVDTEGKPAFANVMLTSPVFVTTFSGERGYFSITHLPPVSDKYILEANSQKFDVPAAPPGTLISDIVITVPAVPKPPEGSVVEGVVVDPQGTPLGGLDVRFEQDTGKTKAYEQTVTNSRGQFNLEFKSAGPASAKVYKWLSVKFGNEQWSDLRECTVLEGAQVDVATDTPQQMRIVAELPKTADPFVVCWAEDGAGNAVDAKVHGYTDQGSPRIQSCGNSHMVTGFERFTACFLEFTAEGYQARVLEMGKDFKAGDRSMRVVMKKGPYAAEESVWTAATGRPDSEKAINHDDPYYINQIKQRLAEYEKLAGREGAKVEASEEQKRRGPQAPREIDILAVDVQGKPVTEITYQPATARGEYSVHDITPLNAMPAPGTPKQSASDPNGRYRVPNMCLVYAQGSARRLVAVQPHDNYEPPITLTFGPPASITLTVLDSGGKPVSGAVVVPLDEMWTYLNQSWQRVQKTGSDGKLRIEGLPVGYYIYAVAPDRQGQGGQVAAARLNWGENVETTVKIPAPPTPGTVEAMLAEWREHTSQPEVIKNAVAALDKSQKRKLEAVVLDQLRQIPIVVRMNTPQVTVLARVAAALGLRKAIEPLQALFPSAIHEQPGVTVWFGQGTEAIMDALVSLGSDKMTGYFEKVAGDPQVLSHARTQAIIALGRIGTDNSVAAFKRLRDAAYGKNGAPQCRQTYTYGERLAEAAAMTMMYIPGATGGPQIPLTGEGVWIGPDYNEGRIAYMHYMLHFKRFGDEWMLVKMEGMPMP